MKWIPNMDIDSYPFQGKNMNNLSTFKVHNTIFFISPDGVLLSILLENMKPPCNSKLHTCTNHIIANLFCNMLWKNFFALNSVQHLLYLLTESVLQRKITNYTDYV